MSVFQSVLPFILKGALGVAGLYLGLCLFLGVWQNRLIFVPRAEVTVTPEAVDLPYEDVWLSVPGGQGRIHGWWLPASSSDPSASQRVLLHFHGNGGNVGSNLGLVQKFHQLGLSILLIDYRGYGRSVGKFPTETSVYQDAEAAWQYLVQERRIEPSNIVLYGHSLGGAIAIHLATHHPDAGALIVESSFTSMANMAKEAKGYTFIPVDILLTQRFDSITKLPTLDLPIFFIHGTDDATVPAYMSEQLHQVSPNSQLLLVPGADHNDVAEVAGMDYLEAVKQFIDQAMDRADQPVS